MSQVRVVNVEKSFSPGVTVLQGINLEINPGEFVCLFGPNGCGKTTLLNIIAGVISPDLGYVTIDNRPPRQTIVGYVFQNYRDSLLPWRTNLENIALPLEIRGVPKAERIDRVRSLVQELDLTLPLLSYPYQSSGGEQQLVAVLREVIAKPKIILMDEPFSALHHESRNELRARIQQIWQKLGLTILFVSHDMTETLQLGDRILLMAGGPGRIAHEFSNHLPHPRTAEVVGLSQFQAMKQVIANRLSLGHEADS